jgi:hypothetical protein
MDKCPTFVSIRSPLPFGVPKVEAVLFLNQASPNLAHPISTLKRKNEKTKKDPKQVFNYQ